MKKILFLLLLSVSIYGQTTGTALKAQIDTDITNKTGNGSISKINVGGNLKSVVDYVDQKVPTKTSIQVMANDTNPPEINSYYFIRCFTSGSDSEIKLTGAHEIGREYYIKNTTAFPIVLLGVTENINGNSTLNIPAGTYWHLIKEDNSTNSITAFKLSLM